MAQEYAAGVTVGDVLNYMARFLSKPLLDGDLRDATPSHRAAMEAFYEERMSRSPDPSSMCIHDWLLGRSVFDGFAHDPNYTSPDILGIVGEVYLRLSVKE